MRSKRPVRIVKFAVFAVAAVAVVGFLVMSLWNWLMPAVFGLRPIGFWQSLGLFLLGKLLLGGIQPTPGRHSGWRRRMLERWEQMTPEERERFREAVRACTQPAAPEAPGRA